MSDDEVDVEALAHRLVLSVTLAKDPLGDIAKVRAAIASDAELPAEVKADRLAFLDEVEGLLRGQGLLARPQLKH